MLNALVPFLVATVLATGSSAEDKKTLIVTAVTHKSRLNEQTAYHTTPAQSTTDCSGTGTDSGSGTTKIQMDCKTTTSPPKTTSLTTQTTEVTEKVIDSENMVYTIVCTDRPNPLIAAIAGGAYGASAGGAGGGGNATVTGRGNCVPLNDGDRFEAEVKGTIMWVHAQKGGNQGKGIKIKYKILDIRKQTPLPPESNSACQGDERDNSEVWRLGRSLGRKDSEITEAVTADGVCKTLLRLREEVHPN